MNNFKRKISSSSRIKKKKKKNNVIETNLNNNSYMFSPSSEFSFKSIKLKRLN